MERPKAKKKTNSIYVEIGMTIFMCQVHGANWLDNQVTLLVGSLINQLLSYWEFTFLLA